MTIEFISESSTIDVYDSKTNKIGVLTVYTDGEYEETSQEIIFKKIFTHISFNGTTDGNGLRVTTGIYVGWTQDESGNLIRNNVYSKSDLIYMRTNDAAGKIDLWPITTSWDASALSEDYIVEKKLDETQEIVIQAHIVGENVYFDNGIQYYIQFSAMRQSSNTEDILNLWAKGWKYVLSKSLNPPNPPKNISLTYPTPDAPNTITVNWEYGEVTENPPNAPTGYYVDIQDETGTWENKYSAELLSSGWPTSYIHNGEPNKKYRYRVWVKNEAQPEFSENCAGYFNSYVYTQPAPPILTQVYSKGGKVYYNISTDNILAYTSGDFNTDPDTGNIWTNVYWRANEEGDWKPAPATKEKSTDVIEIRGKTAFPYQGQLLEGEDPKFITSNDEDATIYKAPNIYTPWIKV